MIFKDRALWEALLVGLVILIFCLSAYDVLVNTARDIYVDRQLYGQMTSLGYVERLIYYSRVADMMAVFTMMISGLGLIFLLLLKLRHATKSEMGKKEALLLADQRLAAIEAAGDGIGVVDPQGNLAYMNRALMDLHGIDPGAEKEIYIGQSWLTLYSEAGQVQIEQEVMPEVRMHGYWNGDSPIVRRDGRIIEAEMSLTLLPDGGMIGTARDISARKLAEKEKNILQRQVYQAQKMEAIGRMAGGIAHDFNNILSSLTGYADFLVEDLPDKSREQQYASRILSGCSYAQDLVNQILMFSRQSDDARQLVDIRRIFDDTMDMLEHAMPPGVIIKKSVQIDQGVIEANKSRIR